MSQASFRGPGAATLERIAAVLLNPFLPDSNGMETVKKLLLAAPTTPLLILGDEEHELFAVEA